MIKVMTIVGTRPELIRLSRTISLLDSSSEHILVHTGQNYDYELQEIFFEQLDIRKPNYFLEAAGDTAMETVSNVISKVDKLLDHVKPDALLILGDTNSALSAIPAKRKKIPIFHMEAGNRCFDQRVPEELNRKVVDHLADINFVLTEHARRYLIAEGIGAETVFKTGSHLFEVLNHYSSDIQKSMILETLGLIKNEYFLVSMHREENVDDVQNLTSLLTSLNMIAEEYGLPIVVSTHPRTRARINAIDGLQLDNRISFLNPFGFFDYIKLQCDSRCVISDSGTITEESSILSFPAITIRNMHERPEGMDAGTLIMTGLNQTEILNGLKITIDQRKNSAENIGLPPDYCNKSVSKQIVKIVHSYTSYVNRVVWKKT